MHPKDGEIRSYLDHELEPNRARELAYHFETCAVCRNRVKILERRAERIQIRMLDLDDPASNPLKPDAARRRLAERLQSELEEISMFKQLLQNISRPTWAAISLVAILAIALAFPQVRAAADSFLQLFRVEQVRVLPVDANALPGNLENSEQLEALFSENVTLQENGEPQEVNSVAEAEALAGFDLRLPAEFDDGAKITVQPGGTANFSLDLEMVRSVLRELGRTDLELPDSIEGAQIQVTIPTGVLAQIGACEFDRDYDPDDPSMETGRPDETLDRNCTSFMQMPSPEVTAPPEMDLQEMGMIYLQVLGMSEDEAGLFAANVDWATTFVVPIPQGSVDYQEVQIDGVPGTLIFDGGYRPAYTLLWIKDEMLYVLSGPGDKAKALETIDSLR